jgi:hypothetical protein
VALLVTAPAAVQALIVAAFGDRMPLMDEFAYVAALRAIAEDGRGCTGSGSSTTGTESSGQSSCLRARRALRMEPDRGHAVSAVLTAVIAGGL